jgi:hypothetical protein
MRKTQKVAKKGGNKIGMDGTMRRRASRGRASPAFRYEDIPRDAAPNCRYTNILVMGMLIGIGGDEGQARAVGSRGCETGHRIGGVFMALVTPRGRPSCSARQLESPGPIDCMGRTWL